MLKHQSIFITGTDTNVGKTFVSVQLLAFFKSYGLSTIAMKPVASGCEETEDHALFSTDALALQQAATISLPYPDINPFAFKPAIAPHIAAQRANCHLSVEKISKHYHAILARSADIYLLEGVGGWLVPLNQHETMADFVIRHRLSIILVVGIRLGCLNHALLTTEMISQTGLTIIGWIANHIEAPADTDQAIVDTLKKWLNIPFLGSVAFQRSLHETKFNAQHQSSWARIFLPTKAITDLFYVD